MTNNELDIDFLLKNPWYIWNDKDKCNTFLRCNLHKALIHNIRLKLFRKYIQIEIDKNRSRKSAAIKRAFRAAKHNTSLLSNTLQQLNLQQLWNKLEEENTHDNINQRLNIILDNNNFNLLKNFNNNGHEDSPSEVQSNSSSIADNSPPEVTNTVTLASTVGPADSSSNYLPVNGRATPGDRGDVEDSDVTSGGTSSGSGSESEIPENDLREFEGEVNKRSHHGEWNTSSGKADDKLSDGFFDMDEMERFADEEYVDDGIDYFSSLGDESDDSIAAADMKYDDFFKSPGDVNNNNDENFNFNGDINELDEDEREMELLLQKYEENISDDDDDELNDYRDDKDEDFMGDIKNLSGDNVKSSGVDADELDEISKIEQQISQPRHWSLMGETTAKNRTRNSLLDLDLELPHTSTTIYDEDTFNEGRLADSSPPEVTTSDSTRRGASSNYLSLKGKATPGDRGDGRTSSEDSVLPLELIIIQRIKSGVFDNVERKSDNVVVKKSGDKDVEIDFNKSTKGLGDIYAERYKQQFTSIDKLDKHKEELTELFSKLMYKLDCLSNSNFIPKRISNVENSADIPTISITDPINIITTSKSGKKLGGVMNVGRSAKKRKFENKIKGLIKSGKITKDDAQRIKKSIHDRNKLKIKKLKLKKDTGLDHEVKPKAKINLNDLLSNQ